MRGEGCSSIHPLFAPDPERGKPFLKSIAEDRFAQCIDVDSPGPGVDLLLRGFEVAQLPLGLGQIVSLQPLLYLLASDFEQSVVLRARRVEIKHPPRFSIAALAQW